jgi:hypothetical protein
MALCTAAILINYGGRLALDLKSPDHTAYISGLQGKILNRMSQISY